MTTATLNLIRVQKSLQSKIDSVEVPSINWKVACFVGIFMTSALLVFYVWQVNSLTRGSYIINSYEKQISELSRENKNLEVVFAENSFLGQAFQKIQALNFQKTTSVKYIQILDSAVGMVSPK